MLYFIEMYFFRGISSEQLIFSSNIDMTRKKKDSIDSLIINLKKNAIYR